jgi:hypothetical protein
LSRADRTGLRGTRRVKDKGLRPSLAVIVGGESLVSHAGGALLVETARRSGLAVQSSVRSRPNGRDRQAVPIPPEPFASGRLRASAGSLRVG